MPPKQTTAELKTAASKLTTQRADTIQNNANQSTQELKIQVDQIDEQVTLLINQLADKLSRALDPEIQAARLMNETQIRLGVSARKNRPTLITLNAHDIQVLDDWELPALLPSSEGVLPL
jgi:hypothetical protein